jgi:hypothetical protein
VDICTRHNLSFKTVHVLFPDEINARIWIRSNQIARRNLSDAWKIELALGNKEDLALIGKEKKIQTLKQGTKLPVLSNNDKTAKPPAHNTRSEIAKTRCSRAVASATSDSRHYRDCAT